MKARDGREFELNDTSELINAFTESGVDLPVDYEHQYDKADAKQSGPVPVAGWIKALEIRSDGLWGQVEWTETANELISKKEYRYLSPSFLHENGHIKRLQGAGLVHRPALQLTALASEESKAIDKLHDGDSRLIARLAKIFALGENPTDDDVISAIAERLNLAADLAIQNMDPDPSRYVPVEAVAELANDRSQQIHSMHQREVERSVEQAIDQGHITPGMRDWATALASSNPESFESFIAASLAPYGHLGKAIIPDTPPESHFNDSSPDAMAICEMLGLEPGSIKL
jgi:phage I-like protein